MKKENSIFISLVREAMMGRADGAEPRCFESEDLQYIPQVMKLAEKHDVLPIVAEALERYDCPDGAEQIFAQAAKHKFLAVYRMTLQNAEKEAVRSALEEAGIPFILLKGALLRDLYPEAWMRTSSDVDLLVEPHRHEEAKEYLEKNLGYTYFANTPHDVSFYSQSGVHIELHFKLIEKRRALDTANVLDKAWEYSVPKSDGCYERVFKDEMFYYYHIAHMAKHFLNGGCGVRFLLDLYILNNLKSADKEKRSQLLANGGLIDFARTVSALAEYWFGEGDADEITLETEDFILTGGLYGTRDTHIINQVGVKGSKFRYFMSRIFIPYEEFKRTFPKMGKYKILIPIMHIRRILRLLNPDKRKRVSEEVKKVREINNSLVEKLKLY